jgi:DNA end-binding protein Ku
MQTIWKGSIAFGLVTIPIRLYTATSEHSIGLHQVRASDGSRVRQRRVAEADGAEVAYQDVAKGYELPDGATLVLTDEDLASLPVATQKTIEVVQFTDEDEVDPVLLQKTYYLEPDKTGTKPYVLLRDALKESGRVGIVKVAIRQRETLAVLRVRGEVFTLTTMLWADEVREPSFAFQQEDVKISPAERAIADQLITAMSARFHPVEHSDSYATALRALIEAKSEGREPVPSSDAVTGEAEVVDLMAALKATLAAKDSSKSHHPAGKQAAGTESASGGVGAAGGRSGTRNAPSKRAPTRKSA